MSAAGTAYALRQAASRITGLLRPETGLWRDTTAIRSELFGTERLEHHALTLAAAQTVARVPGRRVPKLTARVKTVLAKG